MNEPSISAWSQEHFNFECSSVLYQCVQIALGIIVQNSNKQRINNKEVQCYPTNNFCTHVSFDLRQFSILPFSLSRPPFRCVFSNARWLLLFRLGRRGGLLLDLFRITDRTKDLRSGFGGKNGVGIGAKLHERAAKISLNRRRKCSAVCQRTRLACLFNRKESISRAHLSSFLLSSLLSSLPSSIIEGLKEWRKIRSFDNILLLLTHPRIEGEDGGRKTRQRSNRGLERTRGGDCH